MAHAYAKGHKPGELYAACGGPTLDRVRDFTKSAKGAECCEIGPYAKQDYSAKGSPAKRTGDKCLPAVKPRS